MKIYIYLFFEAPRALHCPPAKRPCTSCLPVLLHGFCCRIRPDDARSAGLDERGLHKHKVVPAGDAGQGHGSARMPSASRCQPLEAANSPKISFSFAFGTSLLFPSSRWAQPRAVPAARGTRLCLKQAAGFIPGGANPVWHSPVHLHPPHAPSAELLPPRWKGILDPRAPRWKGTSDTISLTPRGPGRTQGHQTPQLLGKALTFPGPSPDRKHFQAGQSALPA